MSKSKISFMNHDRHVHIHIFHHSPFSSVYIVQSSFNKRAIEWLHCECMTKMKSLPRLPCNSNIYIYRSPGRIAIRMCEQQTESQMTNKYEWTKSRAFFYYLCLFDIGDGVVCRLVASSSLAPLNLCVLCRVNGKKNESEKKVNDQWLSIRSLIKSSQMCVDRWLSISPLPIEYYNIEIENAQQYKESKTNRWTDEEWKWIKITCYSYSYSYIYICWRSCNSSMLSIPSILVRLLLAAGQRPPKHSTGERVLFFFSLIFITFRRLWLKMKVREQVRFRSLISRVHTRRSKLYFCFTKWNPSSPRHFFHTTKKSSIRCALYATTLGEGEGNESKRNIESGDRKPTRLHRPSKHKNRFPPRISNKQPELNMRTKDKCNFNNQHACSMQ